MSRKSAHKPKTDGIAVRCSFSRMVEVSKLKPNPRNPNKHPPEQLDLYSKVIRHQGWRRPIVVSRQSGLVVTGHGALQTALKMGWKTVPVDYQDFASKEDELGHLLADNKLPELSELSAEEARAIEMELSREAFDLELTGMDLQEIEKLRRSESNGGEAGRTEVTIPECWNVLVTCKTEEDQAELLEKLETQGFECQALIS